MILSQNKFSKDWIVIPDSFQTGYIKRGWCNTPGICVYCKNRNNIGALKSASHVKHLKKNLCFKTLISNWIKYSDSIVSWSYMPTQRRDNYCFCTKILDIPKWTGTRRSDLKLVLSLKLSKGVWDTIPVLHVMVSDALSRSIMSW